MSALIIIDVTSDFNHFYKEIKNYFPKSYDSGSIFCVDRGVIKKSLFLGGGYPSRVFSGGGASLPPPSHPHGGFELWNLESTTVSNVLRGGPS